MKVYMEVTQDKYELPVAVADSVRELAYVVGVKENTVCNIMSRAKKRGGRCKYIKVELEEGEIDD